MNEWLDTLQRFPTLAFFWISTKAPIFGLVADFAAVEIDEFRKANIYSQLDVVRNAIEGVHR